MGYNHFRYARRIDGDNIGIYHEDMTKLLQLDKGLANYAILKGGLPTGKSLKLLANDTQSLPEIDLHGGGYISLNCRGASQIRFSENSVEFIHLYEDGTDDVIEGKSTNNDLFLNPDGTGVVKFGTKTGTGDAAVDGYVSTKDSLGNAVKLATVA